MDHVGEIEWKGAIWRAAYGGHTIKELLTILKGFGPMEVLEFEKPGECWGQISLYLLKDGKKEITLYGLEIQGEKRKGRGRAALWWLKDIFKGDVYVEDVGGIRVKDPTQESLLFWVKMFREGLITALEGSTCCLDPTMCGAEIDRIEADMKGVAEAVP